MPSRTGHRHVAGRTTHIDIDDLGAGAFGDPRTFRHPACLAARELNDMRAYSGRLAPQPRHWAAIFTRSSLAVISETTNPAPRAAVKRRKGASVTPDIGARMTRLAS